MYAQSLRVLCFTCLHKTNLPAKIRILGVDTIQVLPNFVPHWISEAARERRGVEVPSRGITFEICVSHLSHPQNSSFLSMDPIFNIPFYWAARTI